MARLKPQPSGPWLLVKLIYGWEWVRQCKRCHMLIYPLTQCPCILKEDKEAK